MVKLGEERTALAAFAVMSILAGGNGVAIRFSNRELAPLWGAALRFSLAAALLALAMAVLRLHLPRGRALGGGLLYGTFAIGSAFALAYYGLVEIHAGLGQTLLALVPLVTLFLAVLQRQERLRGGALAGGLLALAGIAVMPNTTLRAEVPLVSFLALVGSACCFAQAAVLVRRFPRVHPITMNAIGVATGALLLFRRLPRRSRAPGAAGSAVDLARRAYLVPIGSVLVFVLYLVVLRYWTASRASFQFVLLPVVTVALSAWLDDEAITAELLLGGLLVLAGVYVGALRLTPSDTIPT